MRRSRPAATLVALVLVGTTACAASYRPRPGPRIVEVSGAYHRDGKTFSVGPLGGGAEELVAGNPRALEYARRKQSLSRRGLLVYGLGLVTMIAGSIGASLAAPKEARTPVFFGVLGGGAVVSSLGFYWDIESNAALLDAVNVYNDDVDAARAAAAGSAR